MMKPKMREPEFRRGDVVTVALRGDFSNKPRPAVIVQSDLLADHVMVTVTVLPLTSTTTPEIPLFRVPSSHRRRTGYASAHAS